MSGNFHGPPRLKEVLQLPEVPEIAGVEALVPHLSPRKRQALRWIPARGTKKGDTGGGDVIGFCLLLIALRSVLPTLANSARRSFSR